MYSVVIVEDDPMIAELNRRYVEKDGRFAPVQCFAAPRPALDRLRRCPADLVILDFYMPQMTGLEFLRAVRAAGIGSDVIMITAANDAATVEALTRLGIVDYLVKPFAYERFCRALDGFCRRRAAMQGGSLDQSALDSLLHDAPPAPLPKGLQAQTLEKIAACLRAAGRRNAAKNQSPKGIIGTNVFLFIHAARQTISGSIAGSHGITYGVLAVFLCK